MLWWGEWVYQMKQPYEILQDALRKHGVQEAEMDPMIDAATAFLRVGMMMGIGDRRAVMVHTAIAETIQTMAAEGHATPRPQPMVLVKNTSKLLN